MKMCMNRSCFPTYIRIGGSYCPKCGSPLERSSWGEIIANKEKRRRLAEPLFLFAYVAVMVSLLIFVSSKVIYEVGKFLHSRYFSTPEIVNTQEFYGENRLLAFQSYVDGQCKRFGIPSVEVKIVERNSSHCRDCIAFYSHSGPTIVLLADYINSHPSVSDIVNTLVHESIHAYVAENNLYSDVGNGHNEWFLRKAIEVGLNIDNTLNRYPEIRPIYERLLAERKNDSIYSQQYLQKKANELCTQLQIAPARVEVINRSNKDCGCASDYHPDKKTIFVNAEYLYSRPEQGALEEGLKHDLLHHWAVVNGVSNSFCGGHGEAYLRKSIDLNLNVDDVLAQWPELRPIYKSLVDAKRNAQTRPLI